MKSVYNKIKSPDNYCYKICARLTTINVREKLMDGVYRPVRPIIFNIQDHIHQDTHRE